MAITAEQARNRRELRQEERASLKDKAKPRKKTLDEIKGELCNEVAKRGPQESLLAALDIKIISATENLLMVDFINIENHSDKSIEEVSRIAEKIFSPVKIELSEKKP